MFEIATPEDNARNCRNARSRKHRCSIVKSLCGRQDQLNCLEIMLSWAQHWKVFSEYLVRRSLLTMVRVLFGNPPSKVHLCSRQLSSAHALCGAASENLSQPSSAAFSSLPCSCQSNRRSVVIVHHLFIVTISNRCAMQLYHVR